jgi:outer membrane biosynthesis protein TonB
MARLSALFLAFLLGTASVATLASCGGGSDAELLPGTTADQIESNLDQVAELAGEDDCIGAEDAVAEVTAEVEELQGVDLKLKTALQEGTTKLSEVVGRCEEETSEEAEPELETTVEADELEEEEKPKKDKKAEKEEEAAEQEEEAAEDEGPKPAPPSDGNGEENGKGGGEEAFEPEGEETPPSGGVGPSVGVEKE